MGGHAQSADAGSIVQLPQGAWFRWENHSDQPASILFIFTPAGFEQFYIGVMDGIGAAGGDPSILGTVINPPRAAYGDEAHPAGC